jgi:hypothetical protein
MPSSVFAIADYGDGSAGSAWPMTRLIDGKR